jgi:kynurenine formamidase
MQISVNIGDAHFALDSDHGIDISIPIDFAGPQLNVFDAPTAESTPLSSVGFIGDTRQGGSCNVDVLRLIPHCNGTHTECVGHISRDRHLVLDSLASTLFPCVVVSVSPIGASDTAETALDELSPESLVVTRQDIERHIRQAPRDFRRCLVVRTFPNHRSKIVQHYGASGAAFFSRSAIQCLIDHDVQHLITDLPSIDPLDDPAMHAHHLFWDLDPDARSGLGPDEGAEPSRRTITELVYIPDEVEDGLYVVDLQVAPFKSDAAPSRPILYPVQII